ncbi:TIGR03086 family protein [Streptomyces inusitatus]|uniref:TIGR03086 family protein n=1 Tax=Streptomyces inusitatus TaxID=68221 RepID=A0A918QGM1_9ACTN|nr:TIGR03086 family metal-binding protein [Streptomyces inusitatus]GGZ48551.1 TIGR03086 family protein [Streptomyces inusitatus]
MNDFRLLHERAADQFAELLKTVTPERLGDPTPCPEFDVRALLAHVVNSTHWMAFVGEGGDFRAAPTWSEEVADGEWVAVYDRARGRFDRAWADDAKLARTTELPWGTMPGAGAVAGAVMETATHTWDLSKALGHPLVLDPEPAEAVLPIAREALAADRRGEEVPFGPVREAGPDAGAHERLAAWLGREVS